jgi:hypothetical protein
MIIQCNRIIFPTIIDDDDEVIRDAKLKQAAKNIRKRRVAFHLDDVEKISEHEDSRFVQVWFYYSEPMVIEYPFEEMLKAWLENQENDSEDRLQFWIPAN